MKRIDWIATTVLLALATLFFVAGPAQAYPMPCAKDRPLIEHQQRVIRAYQARDEVQVANYFAMQARIDRLEQRVRELKREVKRAYRRGVKDGYEQTLQEIKDGDCRDWMFDILELSEVTHAQLDTWDANGVGYGTLYVTP